MNPEEMLAGMTPEMINQFAAANALMTKKKKKPGPGGTGRPTPAARRMGTDKASGEGDAIREFMQMFGGGQV